MAYPAGGDVYFRVRRMNGYGKLSGRSLDDMVSAEPTDIGVEKEHPMDFTALEGARSQASRNGRAPGAPVDRAGTSNAQRCPAATSASKSICTAAGWT